MIMQILQTCDAPDEAAKLAVEKKPLPMNQGICVSPFTFSRLVQFAGTDSFNSLTSPVSFKNNARRGNCSFPI
jgi:hypothetical protein